MRQAKINKERARRAELALKAQGYWDCGESYAAADLLDDIMHLCIREKWDFEKILKSAREHFACEHTKPDDIELHGARPLFAKGDYPIVHEAPESKR